MDYSPAVPASLAGFGLATFGVNTGTLILLIVAVLVAIGALVIRHTFRKNLGAFDVATS